MQIVKHLHLACTCSLSLCDRGSYAFFGEQGGAAAEAVPHAAGGAAAQLQGLLQGQQPQQQQAPPPAPPLPADMRIRAAEAAMRRQAAGAAAAGEAGETGLAGGGAAAGPAANSAAVPADLCGQAGSAAAGPSSGECPAQGNEGSEEQRMLEAAMAASRQSFTAEQSPRQVGLMCRCVRGNQGNAICRTCWIHAADAIAMHWLSQILLNAIYVQNIQHMHHSGHEAGGAQRQHAAVAKAAALRRRAAGVLSSPIRVLCLPSLHLEQLHTPTESDGGVMPLKEIESGMQYTGQIG